MGPRRIRQYVGVGFVALVTFVGAAWYWLVEGFGITDAIYQAVITVSTVGFGEVNELDTSGRIFTIFLIVVGVAAMVYALGGFAELLIDSTIDRFTSRRRVRTLDRLKNHTIVCGYGRTGAAVVRLIPNHGAVGVVEADAERADIARSDGLAVVHGDCTTDECLMDAGIERAAKLIVCLSSDADAIATALSAKVLNPKVRVVSRVNDASSARKLRLAGADHVVSPIEMGAQRLVAESEEPSIGSFLDAALHDDSIGLSIRAVRVADTVDLTVHELEIQTGAHILGLQEPEGTIIDSDLAGRPTKHGQTVFAVGHKSELAALEKALSVR